MKVVIFGAGYVGTVTGVCLASIGHEILFIEPNPVKVEAIQDSKSPISEPMVEDLLQSGLKQGRIQAKAEATRNDLLSSDLAMIAVATPTLPNGALQLDSLRNVLINIRGLLTGSEMSLPVAIRSTVHPLAIRRLECELCLGNSRNISIVVNPEFLRESSAINDFFHAPFCVAGGDDEMSVRKTLSLYLEICPKQFVVGLETACLLKYACNAFHALKITFANEIGFLCESLKINPLQLMEIFCEDKTLNCSQAYLKPGFAFGGSCLPKDLRALLSLGRELEENLPLLSAILPSNQHALQRVLDNVLCNNHNSVAVIGMSFKKNNDDLRESPFLELTERLIGKGLSVRIYDPDVRRERLIGSNLEVMRSRHYHLVPYLYESLSAAIEGCDGVILCKDFLDDQTIDLLKRQNTPIYDLQNLLPGKCSGSTLEATPTLLLAP